MSEKIKLPKALIVTAYLFIIAGWLTVIGMVVSLFFDRLEINFGFIGIFVGRGLLRLDESWRKGAMFFVWLLLIACPVMVISMFVDPTEWKFVIGRNEWYAESVLQIMIMYGIDSTLFVVALWMRQVLLRPDIINSFSMSFDRKMADELSSKWQDNVSG